MEKYIKQAITEHQNGRLEKAEILYRNILKENPNLHNVHSNLGHILLRFGKLEDAELSFKKAISIKPDYPEAHNNLGSLLQQLKKLSEAELCFKKALKFKPDFAEAYNNYSGLLKILGRLNEAEINARKAIELKPHLSEAYSNLGNILKDLGRSEESELNSRKALELNPDSDIFKKNLNLLLKQNKLLSLIKKEKFIKSDKSSLFNLYLKFKKIFFNKKIKFNKFITHMSVTPDLVSNLYKINLKDLDETKDKRYGNGKCSDYNLFSDNSIFIKNLEKDLTKVMSNAVGSNIFIMESFFNIFKTGSGITAHDHISSFDKAQGLFNQKYSLTYYLSIGDQNSKEPGILKLQNPHEEILPSEGTIVIFPAHRKHSAIYEGKKDRVMVGVNFYSLN